MLVRDLDLTTPTLHSRNMPDGGLCLLLPRAKQVRTPLS